MTEPPAAGRDWRFWVFLANAVLAVALGFLVFSSEQSLRVIIYGGYWIMLVLGALFAWSLWRVLRPMFPGWAELRARPRWPAALIVACTGLLLVHEAYGFKILMDEIMLLGTSMSLHFDKVALVPMRGHDIQGAFQLLSGELDKRPLFHPFLLCLLHDVTGYRPENAFVLNTALTGLLLTLAYHAAARIAGRAAGAVAVLLLTGLPLLAQNATGGGFEILNLVMILSTLLLTMRFAERRDPDTLNALGLSGVLLAQTRYESVVFLLPVGLVVLWAWWRERKPVLGWAFAFVPLMLVPYALHNQVFRARTSSWELFSQPGYEKPFSPAYVPDNLGHALNYFFDFSDRQPNSLALSFLGFLAIPFLLFWLMRVAREASRRPPAHLAMAIFATGFIAHTALMMGYFWGRFDDPVITRLSLPAQLFLVLGVVCAGADMPNQKWVWRGLGCAALVGLFGQSLPSMSRHQYSLAYYYGAEMQWRRDFIAAHPERNYLFIDNSSIIWLTHQVSATSMRQAIDHKENIVFNLRNRSFGAVYVFQRLDVDPDTGRLTPQRDDVLGPDYQLETYWERRFTPLTVSRISRVVSVREGPTARPDPAPPPLDSLPPAERERIRQQYLENFIKRLP